jgi:hypothetical protein
MLNDLEVRYFDEKNKGSGNAVVSGIQLETQNGETEDANSVAAWQQPVDTELVKEDGWRRVEFIYIPDILV